MSPEPSPPPPPAPEPPEPPYAPTGHAIAAAAAAAAAATPPKAEETHADAAPSGPQGAAAIARAKELGLTNDSEGAALDSNPLGLYNYNGNDFTGSLDDGPTSMRAPPPPPHKRPTTTILPFLLLAFFGCFMYQTYQKNKPRRTRTGDEDHEERSGLMDFCRPARSALGNRTSDMLDRRRDQRLATNDFSRTRTDEFDDDGML